MSLAMRVWPLVVRLSAIITTLVTITLGSLLLYIIIDYGRILRLRRRLPPGPFPLPLFGNYFQVPKLKPWIQWEQQAKNNKNPLLTIWSGHRPVIICNDAWTVSNLFDRKSHLYSSRPFMPAMGDMTLSSKYAITALPYGDQWRLHRRLLHNATGSHVVRKHASWQSDEGRVLLKDLIDKPDEYVLSIERYSVSVVSIIGWGRRIASTNDLVAQVALKIMEGVDLVVPCYHIVDILPWLLHAPKWLYSVPKTTVAAASAGINWFYQLSEESTKRGQNFASRLLQEERQNLSKEEIGALTGSLIGGGVDTTTGSILTFILAMCAFPEVQQRAHAELDRVVGQGRSPEIEDEKDLPYLLALVQEVLRWRTVTILGALPHSPIKDDIYRGYLIPKGTAIHGNIWAIHRHPREFPAPDSFRPERFLDGLERPYPNARGHNAFGWGRRQCSGQPLAEQGLRMTIIKLLWGFEILPGLTEGNAVEIDIMNFTASENMRPEPFKARFVPRSDGIRTIIENDAKIALERLSQYDGETLQVPRMG